MRANRPLVINTARIDPAENGAASGVINSLKARGFRMTRLRRALIERFFVLEHPVSAQELQEQLDVPVNKTSVYREIEFLIEQEIIAQVSVIGGKKVYELKSKGHHHVICNECNRIICVDLSTNLGSLMKKVAGDYNFTISGHQLEFSGVCGNCAESPTAI